MDQDQDNPPWPVLREWVQHPVTQWVFQRLRERVPPTAWKTAPDWEALVRLRGNQEVVDWFEGLTERPDHDDTLPVSKSWAD